ncbi:hypothetical protein [Photobacterium sp. J15]|uniref:hypothetical protein n=1 Tax=Photobacterium sp. J15 TaxID=265901 RepID=UPI0007E3627B|nr:hypothetical protein [Photobacterium sp. J15]
MNFRKYFILDFKSYLANGMILGFFTGLIDAVIDVAHYINIGASIGTVIMPVIYLPSDAINFLLICMVTDMAAV